MKAPSSLFARKLGIYVIPVMNTVPLRPLNRRLSFRIF